MKRYLFFEKLLPEFLKIRMNLARPNNPNMTTQDCLEEFSNVKIMKLLYFFIIMSPRNTHLLTVFDNFKAYPKGPVEEDIYFDILAKGGLGNYENMIDEFEGDIPENHPAINEINEVLENERLLGIINNLIVLTADQLSEISHKSPEWVNAKYFKNENSMELTEEIVNLERSVFFGTLNNVLQF